MAYKRILTIQDISCVGQCSMTVALPILSACGHETCVLPTAMLSTHTGGFGRPEVEQLADSMSRFCRHWQENGILFDAVLVGYLGSAAAVAAAEQILDTMVAPGGIRIVDPAMADHGKRYSGLDGEYALAMERLCRKADVILPNLTEAAMFAGVPCREHWEEAELDGLLDALGHPCVVLTGVGFREGETGVLVRQGSERFYYPHRAVAKSYHGTGDIFAACFTGALLQEKTMEQAVRIAAEYTRLCIENTFRAPAHWYGVKFETALPDLIRLLQE